MAKPCLTALKTILIVFYVIQIIGYSVVAISGFSSVKDQGISHSFLMLIVVLCLIGSAIGLLAVVREGRTTLLVMIVLEIVCITLSIAIGQMVPSVTSVLTVILLAFYYCSIDQKHSEECVIE